MPVTESVWAGLEVLRTCYERAIHWINDPKYPARTTPHILTGILRKNDGAVTTAKSFIQSCQVLAVDGSDFSPLIWTWWRIMYLLKEGKSPYATDVVWSERVNEPAIRRFFYEETSYTALYGKPIWPTAASQVAGLWKQLKDDVLPMDPDDARAHWRAWKPAVENLLVVAGRQRDEIVASLSKRVANYDIGVWLSDDLLKHLRLNKRAAVLAPKVPRVRRKKA